MKIVLYMVKEDDLNIQSSNSAGSRLGWFENSWIIDIGFAQQWLIYYRQLSVSFLLPMRLMDCLTCFDNSFIMLSHIYQEILKEDWSKLFIHGEPISLSTNDVQLLSPLIDPEKLIVPTFLHSKNSSLHPSSIVWPDVPITNANKALPGVGFLIGIKEEKLRLIGCCLINYWLKEGHWVPSLGPYLLITDKWQHLKDELFIVRKNDKIVSRQKVNLWKLFMSQMKTRSWSDDLSSGEMISTIFYSSAIDVESSDQVEIEMGYLGRLQNRVDKT